MARVLLCILGDRKHAAQRKPVVKYLTDTFLCSVPVLFSEVLIFGTPLSVRPVILLQIPFNLHVLKPYLSITVERERALPSVNCRGQQ